MLSKWEFFFQVGFVKVGFSEVNTETAILQPQNKHMILFPNAHINVLA